MPKKSPEKTPKQTAKQARATGWNDPLRPQQPLVSGKWLLSALAGVIALGAVCAYATLCLLFYQGSWQLIFHPSSTVNVTPKVSYQEIHFDYTETGQPQLTGWWIPAAPGAPYPGSTILLLHDGQGSLSDTVAQLETLHGLGINLFAFDYRGFGKSANLHPSESSLNQDADAAMSYLSGTRHLPPHSILLYGSGLGASIAASTAALHPEIPGIILDQVSPDALTILSADARSRILPVRLLTGDRFDIASVLQHLQTPKLFLTAGDSMPTATAYKSASDPKQFLEIAPTEQEKYQKALGDFLEGLHLKP
ncbi:alpha/beta hydrolase [Acidobacterium sp. S8]|uniref:alpha/beta hydrolase n=1 Tax=Acidobacterium sp. S8 TaxID=1641854 RepID=UPI00131E8C05|nr:alpha/beta hydrolase [Acidobacterium sp. S8]